MRLKSVNFSQLALLTLVAFGLPVSPSFALVEDLAVVEAELMPPGGGMSIPMWAFVDDPGTCPLAPVTWQVGPKIVVPPGDSLTINLRNCLSGRPVSVVIPGQAMPSGGSAPVWTDGSTGARTDPAQRVRSFTHETPPDGTTIGSYTWTTVEPGTYLYHSGTHPQVQVQMGLYGAVTNDSAANMAYDGVPYTQERHLFYSEVDPALHNAVDDGSYGTTGPTSTLDYLPKYFLLHGWDGSAWVDVSIDTGTIPPTCIDTGILQGDPLLLRLYNAGLRELAPMMLGGHFDLVAEGGKPYPFARNQYQTLLMPGSTKDAVFTPEYAGTFPIVERRLNLTDASESGGGMQTCLQVGYVAVPPTVNIVSPAEGSTAFGNSVLVQIDGNDTEDAAGTMTVEWDVEGGASQPASWAGTYYEAAWDTTAFGDGGHIINARATDSDTNTVTDSNNVTVSNQPAVSVVAPGEGDTISGNSVLVQIDASDAEDAAGSLTVTWDVDGGTSVPASYNGVSGYYEANLNATALADGAHTINAQATDSRANVATDSNNVTVGGAANTAPVVTITNPLTGATYTNLAVIPFTGTAMDAEDGNIAGSLSWTSDGNPIPGGTGASFSTTLPVGNHTIEASVTDGGGLPGSDSITVNIIPATTDSLFCNTARYQKGPDRMTIEAESTDTSGTLTMTAVMDVAGNGFTGGDDIALNAMPFTPQTATVYQQVTEDFSTTYGVSKSSITSLSQIRVTSSLGGQCTTYVQARGK